MLHSQPATVLIADDEAALRRALERLLSPQYEVRTVTSAEEALDSLKTALAHVVLMDVSMPGMGGQAGLVEIRRRFPGVEVIIMTGQGTIDLAVQCMRDGAFDFLTKPFEPLERVTLSVRRALERQRLRFQTRDLQRELSESQGFRAIVGESQVLRDVMETAMALAARDTTVLIEGESGTGKELVARGIHLNSERHAASFVAVNCGALPADVVESELFGHVKGAFTGAVSDSPGLFREANGGTLFLDEIGELSPAIQVKLLRVLQEKEVRPVGSTRNTTVDVRLIAATNRDLEEQVEQGTFRADLYYRLAVVPIRVPPLRERPEDIPLLFAHFWTRLNGQGDVSDVLEPAALDALTRYAWPGNVRELQNVVERLHILSAGTALSPADLPAPLQGQPPSDGPHDAIPLTLEAYEKLALTRALRENRGNPEATARALGISRATLYRKLRAAGLSPTDFQG